MIIMDTLQWQAFLKSCLDILRNGDSKYDGLKAINEFITLITLKLVENRICEMDNNFDSNDDKIRIGLDCRFTNLYENYCKYNSDNKLQKAKDLFVLLYDYERMWDIEDELDDDLNHVSQVKKRNNKLECIIHRFNKYTINLNKLTDNVIDVKTLTSFTKDHIYDVQKLIIKIQETFGDIDIEHFTYDAFGDAYEKMIADELGNGSKRNGQYFTKRDLIKYIINELEIKETDVCYDPACGTGGFILGFASKFRKNKKFIKNNIYGQEYLDDVYKTLNFNMLANNYDKALKHISRGDSIRHINYHNEVKNKFDVIGANPPFGLSIDVCPKEYPINNIKNSVALFLQHIYFSLKDNGRAGIIIDRGILNNGTDKKNAWEVKLRKFLLEKTNITKIINLPTGIFKHTNFATSVIFFTKGIPTKEIKYIEAYFKDEDKGKGEKQMYLGEEKILTIKEIKEKNYSLKYDDYYKVKEDKQDTMGWLKLGDICNLNRGKTLTLIQIIEGKYPVIGGGQKPMGYHKEFNRKENTILISQSGSYAGYLSKYQEKVWASDCFSIESKDNLINENLLWYYLKFNQENIYRLQHGNGQPHVNTNDMKDFLIPNLSLAHQEEIVNFLDEIYQTAKIEDTIKHLKDKPIFNLLIAKNYDGFRDIIFFQENIPKLIFELENIPRKKNLQIQSIFQSYKPQCEIKKLGDIVEIQFGTRITKGKNEVNKTDPKAHPVYGGGDISFYTNEYNRNGETIIISRFGVSPKCVRVVNGKFFLNDSGMSINILNNKETSKNYIKYYLLYFQQNIFNNYASGNAQKNMETEKLKREFKIPVPPLEVQEEIIKRIEALEQESSHYNQYAKMLETELNNIMEIINNMTISDNQDNTNESINDNLDDSISESISESINDNVDESISDEEKPKKSSKKKVIIEYKNKKYILKKDKVYKMDSDGNKGEYYGTYENNKVKKHKSNDIEISI